MRIFRYLLTFSLSFAFVFAAGCSDPKPDYSEFYKPQPGDEPEEPVNPGLEDNQLRVMSFNVRYSSGDDGANSWDNRKKAVPAMFADQQPTVLGVQEARLDQKTYMDENCAGYKSVGVGRTDGQNAGEFMAIYYLADAVKLEKWGTFWLSDTPDVPSVGWDASTYRTATWALFTHYKSGRKFFYVNTHIDHVGQVADQLLGGSFTGATTLGIWLGALMYMFQIYFDFSGYSDMAIGLGRIFGFRYMENFKLPYTSKSISEFWRRWHISLSSFFRDYVYIPLGGNRRHVYLNLFIVWALTGLWHGASWNFVLRLIRF